jgi:predicted nucleic-acid-binding Zn-ribbon protein
MSTPINLPAKCSNCGSDSLYVTRVASGGGYGPQLLPGLGKFLRFPYFHLVACSDCGYVHFFMDEDAKSKLAQCKKWKQLRITQ